ncbi:MAG TPA: hypothetical protein VIH53_01440 [Gemmatimonadaceae bacterium]
MKKIVPLALLCAAAQLDGQQAKPFDFSIKNIMRGPELYGRQPSDVPWSADSKWTTFAKSLARPGAASEILAVRSSFDMRTQ